MPSDGDWKLFEIHHSNLQSISKTQNLYVNVLLIYLAIVWTWHNFGEGAITLQVAGATLKAEGFWPLTPAILTVISLGIIGTMSAMNLAYKRLADVVRALALEGDPTFTLRFYELDTHKNILDYFAHLHLHPEERKDTSFRRFRIGFWLYPALLVCGVYTTWYAGTTTVSQRGIAYAAYWIGCLLLQSVFLVRVIWRAICRFLGIRRHMFLTDETIGNASLGKSLQ